MMEFSFLTHGIDWLEIAYYLNTSKDNGCQLNFSDLALLRDSKRQSKKARAISTLIGGREFLLLPHGTSSGYSFVMENEDFSIQFGEFNKPSFMVKFQNNALWRKGYHALHQEFLNWAATLGMKPTQDEAVSRVDMAFDYSIAAIDFTFDHFDGDFEKDHFHRGNRQMETFTLGKGNPARAYNKIVEIEQKSRKVWFFEIWGQDHDVWRIEAQMRKELLRENGIVRLADLDKYLGSALIKFFSKTVVLYLPGSREVLHPLWEDLLFRARFVEGQEIYDGVAKGEPLAQRLLRNIISVYGYTKNMAALRSVMAGTEAQSFEKTMDELPYLLGSVHDPLTWFADVEDKMAKMRVTPDAR